MRVYVCCPPTTPTSVFVLPILVSILNLMRRETAFNQQNLIVFARIQSEAT